MEKVINIKEATMRKDIAAILYENGVHKGVIKAYGGYRPKEPIDRDTWRYIVRVVIAAYRRGLQRTATEFNREADAERLRAQRAAIKKLTKLAGNK